MKTPQAGKLKNTISASTLRKRGRFGNQVFQYAFLKIYSQRHQLRLETPDWIGKFLFGCNDPSLSCQFPPVFERMPQDAIARHCSDRVRCLSPDTLRQQNLTLSETGDWIFG